MTTRTDGDETAGGSRFSGVECVFIVRQRRGLRREWTSGELFMYVSTFIRDDASRARVGIFIHSFILDCVRRIDEFGRFDDVQPTD